MADQWYYEANGQQMGPVEMAELQRLAVSGQLQPTDLVWKVGMHQWAPAGTTRGLFPGAQGRPDLPLPSAPEPLPRTAAPQPVPAAGTSPGGRPVAPRPVGSRSPKPAPKPAGMSPGAKVAIWASVTVSVLVVVIIVIVVIVSTRGDQGDPAIVNGRGNYTVQLGPNGRDVRSVKFTAGRRVRITVASDRQINVQLAVFDPQGRLISQGVGA